MDKTLIEAIEVNPDELLKCPFCGANAKFRRCGYHDDSLIVECGNRFGACISFLTAYTEDAYRSLFEKWNKRHMCGNVTKQYCDKCTDIIDCVLDDYKDGTDLGLKGGE